MSCDRSIDFSYVTQLLAAKPTTGGMCVSAFTQVMTFDYYQTPHSINWMHNDSVVMVEALVFSLQLAGDPFVETVTMVEDFEPVLQWVRAYADTVSVPDVCAITMQWLRAYADAVSVTDHIAIRSEPVYGDQITVSDAVAKHVFKTFADTVAISDSFSNGKNEAVADNVGVTDHGSIVDQNYFDTNTYFLTDYFGYSYSW